jgi:hypothetical protein
MRWLSGHRAPSIVHVLLEILHPLASLNAMCKTGLKNEID